MEGTPSIIYLIPITHKGCGIPTSNMAPNSDHIKGKEKDDHIYLLPSKRKTDEDQYHPNITQNSSPHPHPYVFYTKGLDGLGTLSKYSYYLSFTPQQDPSTCWLIYRGTSI